MCLAARVSEARGFVSLERSAEGIDSPLTMEIERNDSPVVMKDWETPIPFGWRLATTDELKANLDSVMREMESNGKNKIFLSDGSWDRTTATAGSRHDMKVLLFGKTPEFKIFDGKKRLKDIGVGWRFACWKEVRENRNTVKDTIEKAGLKRVCLSDGWVKANGQLAKEVKADVSEVLLIETPVNEATASSPSAKKATSWKMASNLHFFKGDSSNKMNKERESSTDCLPDGKKAAKGTGNPVK